MLPNISEAVKQCLRRKLPRTGETLLISAIIAEAIEAAVDGDGEDERRLATEWVDNACGYYCRFIGLDREWPHTVMDELKARIYHERR